MYKRLFIVFTISFFIVISLIIINRKSNNIFIIDFGVKKEIVISNDYNGDSYHPKVITFNKKWNGYKYWMVYTPLLDDNDQTENPHIVVSNDLIHWKEKEGFSNPLEEAPLDGKNYKIYYSDPVLVYRKDKIILECYFRYVNRFNNEVIVYKKETKDGINYTEKEVAFKEFGAVSKILSPAIIYEKGIYKIWYVYQEGISDYQIKYMETKDYKTFYNKRIIDFSYDKDNLNIWHIDVTKSNGLFHMLISAFEKDKDPTNDMKLFYTNSYNNRDYEPLKIILSSRNIDSFDNKSIYKSSLIYYNNDYYIIYSSISISDKHNLGITKISINK